MNSRASVTFLPGARRSLFAADRDETLTFTPTQDAATAPASVHLTRAVEVLWETWDGSSWVTEGTRQPHRKMCESELTGFSDTTRALTRNGVVSFARRRDVR